jgi:hypothetical protein
MIAVTYFALRMNNNRESAVRGFSVDVIAFPIIGEYLAEFHNCR